MKVMFICGSIEPGRDGVGDYTRRLSQELARNGIQVAVTALHDGHVKEIQDFLQLMDGTEIPVYRLPSVLDESMRYKLLEQRITEFNPDWLSLQYVPFSFHPKGLGFALAKGLKKAGGRRRWQIMVHEIAVGMPIGSSLKEMLWGKAQKFLLQSLIRVLQPVMVHTHTLVYKKQLEKFGAAVTMLPLFSNIPVAHPELIVAKHKNEVVHDGYIDLLVFATVQLGAPIREFTQDIKQYEKSTGSKFRMVFLGRGGRAQADWMEEWEGAGLAAVHLGEQNEEKVSEILAKATFGIFSTPVVLTGKSGAVAAMREHGIHLLGVSGKWEARGLKVTENPFGILEYKQGELDQFFKSKSDFSILPTVPSIAKQFMSDLKMN
ncbi:Glycosyltransferase involved in cell wall bisynthesis [Pedobacter westerhofensis]|uniref:Glycosyltransferase involved in cell wall bisynthesis n=1 Tax=Pedobacter westerhofensis TaxID=425512 RepID=A0A521C5S3_9SPHI|nr:glycosyltransferase [Pedobacter westerhofensis]SMO54772.1 Glycosyltransferase involved in cell wall bisynthesis [Pedobacter westerhofensis]